MAIVNYENPNYGKSNFPARLYINYNTDRHNFTPNWHNEIEIIYIVDGEEKIYIENECIIARPGDIVIINRGRIHTITGEDFIHHCLIPSDHIFDNMCDIMTRNSDIYLQSHIQDPLLSELFLKIIDEHESGKKYSSLFEIVSVQQFLLYLFENYEVDYISNSEQNKSSDFLITTQVISFLRKHLSENFSIDEISNEIGITTPYMCRCVKAATGLSILDHLDILRCTTAKHLLSHSNKKISEIADICGYSSSSYFAKKYKKVMGILPTETQKD